MEQKQIKEKKPEYIIEGPFRFVKGYEHCFRTHAKGRWLNKNILDVLEKEFKAYTREYYKNALENGKVLVNNQNVSIEYNFKHNDLFEHFTLRIEPPVLKTLPRIIFENENYLVVSKPPYMCVHVNGGHLHNTLIDILKYAMNYKHELYTLHRLDKLTSGILILGKNKQIALQFQEEEIEKKYLARVQGNFFPEKEEEIVCEQNIICISKKEGKYACGEEGKKSKTIFKKVWFDQKTNTSLLECQPISGRTHQIRVHLSFLGYPIVNDINYGAKFIGNGILKQLGTNENDNEGNEKIVKKIKTNDDQKQEQQNKVLGALLNEYEWDPEKECLEIYLHSLRYKVGELIFEDEKPYWANIEYQWE